MKLQIIRHGQTHYNAKRLVQGFMDNPLDEDGRNQARALGQILKDKNIHFDILGSTSFLRAKETASIVGSYLGLDVTMANDDLRERDFGPFEGQSIDVVFPKIVKDDFTTTGYEDNEKLLRRVLDGVMKLYNNYSNSSVLFVSHSHVIKSLLILSKHAKSFEDFNVKNASIFFFEVTKDSIEFLYNIDLE